eukprot:364197-Chlamydomonas_euryale.AAC.49
MHGACGGEAVSELGGSARGAMHHHRACLWIRCWRAPASPLAIGSGATTLVARLEQRCCGARQGRRRAVPQPCQHRHPVGGILRVELRRPQQQRFTCRMQKSNRAWARRPCMTRCRLTFVADAAAA